jgi:hypothetical protein
MHDVLAQSLSPILRDVERAGLAVPRIDDADWADDPDVAFAELWSPDGSRTGIYVTLRAPEAERVAMVADQIHEWVIEELWGSAPTNWPRCPRHPDTHPLTISALEVAMWVCPADGTAVAPVGSL